MYKFADNKQNQWAIEINIGTVIDVQNELGYNLLDPGSQIDGIPLPAKILTDDVILCKLIYVIVKDQVEKNGITEKEFFKSLDAQAIKNISEAFVNEYQAFFMSRGRKAVAQGLKEMAQAANEMYDTVLEQSTSKSAEVVSPSPTQEA